MLLEVVWGVTGCKRGIDSLCQELFRLLCVSGGAKQRRSQFDCSLIPTPVNPAWLWILWDSKPSVVDWGHSNPRQSVMSKQHSDWICFITIGNLTSFTSFFSYHCWNVPVPTSLDVFVSSVRSSLRTHAPLYYRSGKSLINYFLALLIRSSDPKQLILIFISIQQIRSGVLSRSRYMPYFESGKYSDWPNDYLFSFFLGHTHCAAHFICIRT